MKDFQRRIYTTHVPTQISTFCDRGYRGFFQRRILEIVIQVYRQLCHPSTDVIDVGCAQGLLGLLLGSRQYVGVDIVYNVDKQIKRTLSSASFIVADAQHLPFRRLDNAIIVAIETIEHLSKPELFLKEASRIASAIIITTPLESKLWKPLKKFLGTQWFHIKVIGWDWRVEDVLKELRKGGYAQIDVRIEYSIAYPIKTPRIAWRFLVALDTLVNRVCRRFKQKHINPLFLHGRLIIGAKKNSRESRVL